MGFSEVFSRGEKIVLIGPFPPPVGGVSVHVSRLYYHLKAAGYAISATDLPRGKWSTWPGYVKLFLSLLIRKMDLVHFHSTNHRLLFILWLVKAIKKTRLYLTLHNDRIALPRKRYHRILFKTMIRHLDGLIVVGPQIPEKCMKAGVELPSKVIVENSFLPPILCEEETILQSYEKSTLDFFQERKPLVIANGWSIRFYNNTDIYGLDMCVELTSKLKQKFPNIGFVFAIAEETANKAYIKKIKSRIGQLGIDANFHFITGNKLIWPLFKKVDLMVRPTYTDGYGISIDEAIYFNCPAVASDACKRNPAAVIFANRDGNDFYDKCMQTLKNTGVDCKKNYEMKGRNS